jgi:hypothetical protein
VAVVGAPPSDDRGQFADYVASGSLLVRVQIRLDRSQVCKDLGFVRADQQFPISELPGFESQEAEAVVDRRNAGLLLAERETPFGKECLDLGDHILFQGFL